MGRHDASLIDATTRPSPRTRRSAMATITPILSARSLIPPADADTDAAPATGSLTSVVPEGGLHPVAPKQSDSNDAVSSFVAMYGLHGAASAATPVSNKSTVADVMRGVSEQ